MLVKALLLIFSCKMLLSIFSQLAFLYAVLNILVSKHAYVYCILMAVKVPRGP